jgi:hypothetical protein
VCQNEWGQTARNNQFEDLIGVQYPFTRKRYKPAQLLAASLLVHGLVIPLALTIPIMLAHLEFPTLFSLNISKYYTVLLFLLYISIV